MKGLTVSLNFLCGVVVFQPGRVATLVPSEDPEECVWGVAYKIPAKEVQKVRSHLDFREKGGYEAKEVTFIPDPPHLKFGNIRLTVYIGTDKNPFFLGPAPIEEMARQIYHSVGPSGSNKDYLLNLAEAVRSIAPHAEDQHLFSLEAAVKAAERRIANEHANTEVNHI